jgi:hypothetical protein
MGQLRTTSIRWSFYFFRQMIPTSTPAP